MNWLGLLALYIRVRFGKPPKTTKLGISTPHRTHLAADERCSWRLALTLLHEDVSSIDSRNERLNLWRKASFLYPSICLFISDTSVIKFSKISSLWVQTSNLLFLVIVSWVCFRPKFVPDFPDLVRSQQTPFSIHLFRNLILNFKELKPRSYTPDEHAHCGVRV